MADRLTALLRMNADDIAAHPAPEDVALLLGKIDQLTNALDIERGRTASAERLLAKGMDELDGMAARNSGLVATAEQAEAEHDEAVQRWHDEHGRAEAAEGERDRLWMLLEIERGLTNTARLHAMSLKAVLAFQLQADGETASRLNAYSLADTLLRALGSAAHADRPQVAYESGFENMDRNGEGPMMVARAEADVRAAMAEKRAEFPEVRYALRRRAVGPWETVEDDFPMPLRGTGRFPHHPACISHPDRVGIFATALGALCRECWTWHYPDAQREPVPITPEDEGIASADVQAQIAADNESEHR